MSKATTIKILSSIILIALVSFFTWDNTQNLQPAAQRLLITDYRITTTRTSNYDKYCTDAKIDKIDLTDTTMLSTATSNRESVNTDLGIDGNELTNKLLNSQLGAVIDIAMKSVVKLAIYVGIFLLPFVLFLWMWPFLCCCCCCPSCCPSKCCQKKEEEAYTKCQLMWPTVVLIMALLLTIGCSIYGFVNASSVGQSFKHLSCSMTLFTDDLLNGGQVTDNTSFFSGLNTLKGDLGTLDTNLGAIQTQIDDLIDTNVATSASLVQSNDIDAIRLEISKIPDNSGTAGVKIPLTYKVPIDDLSPATGTLASTFANTFGAYDLSDTLMQKLYYSISVVKVSIDAIRSNAGIFDSSAATLDTELSPMTTVVNDLVTDIDGMDSSFGAIVGLFSMPSSFGDMGMQAFYGFLIGFSFFALLGALLTACCNKPGCRYLMYFACIFLFIGGFLSLFISIIFSLLVPTFTWTCAYLDVTLADSVGFNANLGVYLDASTLTKIEKCMPFGDGDLVSTLTSSTVASDGLNSLSDMIKQFNKFDPVTLKADITNNFTNLETAAANVVNGVNTDLDTTNYNILKALSFPTNTTLKTGCNASFDADSWVPSNSQTAISCRVSSGTGDLANCPTIGAATCKGCMDTSQVAGKLAYTTKALFQADLDSKYTASCAFNPIMANVWQNYYRRKITVLGQAPSSGTTIPGVMTRINTVKPKIFGTVTISHAFKIIDDFRASLDTINTNLNSIADLIDPKYGMLAGLNCKVFGEDFEMFKNVICGSFYNNLFLIRLTLGIAGWGILFSMCCIVCTGVRHFKQVDKMKKISDMEFKNSFEDGSKDNLKTRR